MSFRSRVDTCEADIGHGANSTNGMRSWKKNCNVLPRGPVMEKLQSLTTIRIVTLYERIGGAQTVDRLVESFYSRMDSLADARTIRAMHGSDLAPTKAVLKQYLGEWLGGPKLYSAEKGDPRLRKRHLHVAIGEAERDAWLLCMRGAMDEVIADAQARQEIWGQIAKLADNTKRKHPLLRRSRASVAGDLGKSLDHLRARGDQLRAFFGKFLQAIETEAVHVAEVLVHHDQASGDQHHAAESLVVHLHHRLHHHAGRALDGQSNRVVEQLQPPESIRIGIPHDGHLAPHLFGDDVWIDEFQIALAVPGAMGILRTPLFDELFDEQGFDRGCGRDGGCLTHACTSSSRSKTRSLPLLSALRSQGGGFPFRTSCSLVSSTLISSGWLTLTGWIFLATT